MKKDLDKRTLVLEVVRGEKPLSALKWAGLNIEWRGTDGAAFTNEANVTAVASIRDISCGLVRYHGRPSQLRKWAIVVEGGSGFLDLADEFETDPDGNTILDGLWAAAFDGYVPESVLAIARKRISR